MAPLAPRTSSERFPVRWQPGLTGPGTTDPAILAGRARAQRLESASHQKFRLRDIFSSRLPTPAESELPTQARLFLRFPA